MEDTLFPAIFSTFAVAVSIPIYYYGMQAFGINGIAFAVSASVALQITILYVIWNRRTKNSGSRDVYLFIGRNPTTVAQVEKVVTVASQVGGTK